MMSVSMFGDRAQMIEANMKIIVLTMRSNFLPKMSPNFPQSGANAVDVRRYEVLETIRAGKRTVRLVPTGHTLQIDLQVAKAYTSNGVEPKLNTSLFPTNPIHEISLLPPKSATIAGIATETIVASRALLSFVTSQPAS